MDAFAQARSLLAAGCLWEAAEAAMEAASVDAITTDLAARNFGILDLDCDKGARNCENYIAAMERLIQLKSPPPA